MHELKLYYNGTKIKLPLAKRKAVRKKSEKKT